MAGAKETVNVEASGADILENQPTAHVDVDRTLINKILTTDAAGGLSQAITYSTGGVAADGNGLYHPLGDHFQSTYVIDGQPISDQQSKVFSTQLPTQRHPEHGGEYGNARRRIWRQVEPRSANITTRSGLGSNRVFGSVDATFGNFGTGGGSIGLGFGNAKFGNFLAIEGVRTAHFLDTPEFTPYHDTGNSQSLFDRMDFQPTGVDSIHLNLFAARNWLQIPEQSRPVGAGSAAARSDLERRNRVASAPLNSLYAVDDQSVRP